MNDRNGVNGCHLGLIQILVNHKPGILAGLPAYVNLRLKRAGNESAVLFLVAAIPILFRFAVADQAQILYVGTGLYLADPNGYVSVLVGIVKQYTVRAKVLMPYTVPLHQITGQNVVLVLFLGNVRSIFVIPHASTDIFLRLGQMLRQFLGFSLLLKLVQLVIDIVTGSLSTEQHLLGLGTHFLCFFFRTAQLVGHFALGFALERFVLAAKLLRLRLLCLQLHPSVFQFFNNCLEITRTGIHVMPCPIHNFFLQSQFFRDGKGVGFTGGADHQSVGRPERLHVKFAGRIDHVLRFNGVSLQFRIVGRGGTKCTALTHLIQNGNCQCGAFDGVGTCPQFVKENEGSVRHAFHNGNDAHHMRGEGGKRLLNTLLVSDIGKDIVKHADNGVGTGGNMKSCLRHQGKQANGF